MASESFYKGTNKYFLGSSEIAWEVIKGLTLSGKVGYNFWSYYNKDYASDFVFNANKTVGYEQFNSIVWTRPAINHAVVSYLH
jgi:hypothetical protein